MNYTLSSERPALSAALGASAFALTFIDDLAKDPPMKAYLVLDFSVLDLEAFKPYIAKVPAFIEKHGGAYIVRGAKPRPIEGDWSPVHMVIIEFPARQNAEDFLADPGFQELAKIRHATTISKLVLVDGSE